MSTLNHPPTGSAPGAPAPRPRHNPRRTRHPDLSPANNFDRQPVLWHPETIAPALLWPEWTDRIRVGLVAGPEPERG